LFLFLYIINGLSVTSVIDTLSCSFHFGHMVALHNTALILTWLNMCWASYP